MNLSEIVAGVGYALSHEPKSDNERRQRKRIVSEVYEELLNSEQWSFLQKIITPFFVYPELNLTWTADNPTFDTYVVTLNEALPIPPEFLGGGVTVFDDNDVEISQVGTRLVLQTGDTLWLSKSLTGSGTVNRLVLIQRARMPDDLGEPLGLVSRIRQQGPVPYLEQAEEQHIMLYDTYRGTWPQAWLIDPPDQVDVAPVDLPVIAFSAGTGANGVLKSNTRYRFFYAWFTQGRFTGHSSIGDITTSSGVVAADEITVTANWLNTDLRGISNHIYVEEANSGTFFRIAQFDGTTAAFTWDGSIEVETPWFDRGPYRYLRIWPRPVTTDIAEPTIATFPDLNTDATGIPLEFRYLFRPTALVRDVDVPLLPVEHHRLLIHMATERLAAKRDDGPLTRYHTARVKEMTHRLRKRYLTETAATHRMRMWTHSLYSARYNRPTITRKP